MSTKKEKQSKWKQIGVVGVDSGQIMIGDPCYIKPESYEENYIKQTENYDFHQGHQQLKYPMGHAGLAVIFNNGIGDGFYKVEAKFTNGSISEVRIKFK
jgi:hypothetical protein